MRAPSSPSWSRTVKVPPGLRELLCSAALVASSEAPQEEVVGYGAAVEHGAKVGSHLADLIEPRWIGAGEASGCRLAGCGAVASPGVRR